MFSAYIIKYYKNDTGTSMNLKKKKVQWHKESFYNNHILEDWIQMKLIYELHTDSQL